MDHSFSYVWRRFEEEHEWSMADVLTDDGNIHAANQYGQILHIDTAQNNRKIIGSRMYKGHIGWGDPVIGAD